MLLRCSVELNQPQKCGKTMVPQEVISAIFGNSFSGRQQDAHELFQFISSKMSDENTKIFGALKGLGITQETHGDADGPCWESEALYRPQNPLHGLVGSTMLCGKCNQKVPAPPFLC